jgi:hypothetical protein
VVVRGKKVVERGWRFQVISQGWSWLERIKRKNIESVQEQSPMNFPGDQTTPPERPKARTKMEGLSELKRIGWMRKARSWVKDQGLEGVE